MRNNYMLRLLLLVLSFSAYLIGHTVKPAYLEIKSIGEYNYITKWKVPLIDTSHTSISPVFPSSCKEIVRNTHKDSTILFISSTLHCKETLIGKTISIKNIENRTRTVIFHFS